MKKLYALLLITLSFYAQAQQGWHTIAPSPTIQPVNALSFINANTGWLALDNGSLLKTTNGGSAWQTQTAIAGKSLYGVTFLDANTGWVLTSDGNIAMTSNGGDTWTTQSSIPNSHAIAMKFTDKQHGWVLLEYDSLLYTTNGGAKWNRIAVNSTEYLYGMKFASNTEGWICGTTGQILHSVNGGLNWTVQNTGTTDDIDAIDFTDNKHGWASGYGTFDGLILHTRNGGTTWDTLTQSIPAEFDILHFTDTLNGYATSYNDGIYKTTDGGKTWNTVYSLTTGVYDLAMLPGGTGYAGGINGLILKSTDSGSSWKDLYSTASYGETIGAISFPDGLHGWAISAGDYIHRTVDSGKTWVDQTPFSSSFSGGAIDFVDSLRGWLAGADYPGGTYGQILRTTNGGASYTYQLSNGKWPCTAVSFADSLHGLAGSDNSMIYYTSNGGSTWDTSTIPGVIAYQQVRGLQLVDDLNGWAVTYRNNDAILTKTTDGGKTWIKIMKDTIQFANAFSALSFVDGQHGYVAGYDFNGTPNKISLWKTTDGGSTWAQLNFPSSLPTGVGTSTINKMHFTDMMHGWVAGGGFESFILYTDDGGATWSVQESGTTVAWYDLDIVNAHVGYAAGWHGIIDKTANGGLVGISTIKVEANANIKVYPNPTSDKLYIVLPSDFAMESNYSIGLYDITGKLIKTETTGELKNEMDVSGISNGIYLLKINSGNLQIGSFKIVVAR